MDGLTTLQVFGMDAFKPGSGVWVIDPDGNRKVGIVTYFSYTMLRISMFKTSTKRISSHAFSIEDVLYNGITITPILGNESEDVRLA